MYLERNLQIVTDHQPLIWLKTADLNTRVGKWRFKLSEYDYEIIYKPGRQNANADALLRNLVEYKRITVLTLGQTLMKNKEENKTKGFNNEAEEPNSSKITFKDNPKMRGKRSLGKRINCAESDSESDLEART